MDSREKILSAVKMNQAVSKDLPVLDDIIYTSYNNPVQQFVNTLQGIGGKIIEINNESEILVHLSQNFTDSNNYITTVSSLPGIQQLNKVTDAHLLENIEVAVIPAVIGVAENSAVWVTDKEIQIRALPFICQHLAVILSRKNIVSNMYEAYKTIAGTAYDFGVFIAGPSKTADIEQSLVLGAHGPKSMTIFLTE